MLHQEAKNWQFGTDPSDVKKQWALAEKDNPLSRIHISSAIPGSVHYHVDTGAPLSPRVRHPRCPTFAYWPKFREGEEVGEKRGDSRKGEGMLHKLIKEAVQIRRAVTFRYGPGADDEVPVTFKKVVLEHSLKAPHEGWRIDIAAEIDHPRPLRALMNEWIGIEVVVAHPPSCEKISMLRTLDRGVGIISAYGKMRAAANLFEADAGGFDKLPPEDQDQWRRRALGFLKTAYLKPFIHIPGLGDPRWNRDARDAVARAVGKVVTPTPNLSSWVEGGGEGAPTRTC